MTINEEALNFHKFGKRPGKISLKPTKPLLTQLDLTMAYSPGVAAPCLEIYKDPETIYEYTSKGNYVAVVTNGTAVLGLGNIGVAASKPVMEGKAVLFKKFADLDAIDIEVDTTDTEEFINIVKKLSTPWGGINLEDIKSPECFTIEERLKKELSIPVFHDDQHGTAITAAAGLINALEITNRDISDIKIVINGPGAAGMACGKFLVTMGATPENITYCDSYGVVYKGRKENMSSIKEQIAVETNNRTLADALIDADVFLGLSVKDALKPEMIMQMKKNPIIFAMANPDPEIKPEDAIKARPDAIIATGRSDYPNQINNVMCFPYIFRGTLDVRATEINNEMKIAAAYAIAKIAKETIPEEVIRAYPNANMQYGPNYIIPSPFDPRLLPIVSSAVAKAAMDTGVAKKPIKNLDDYRQELTKNTEPAITTLTTLHTIVKNDRKKIIFAEGEEAKVIRAAIYLRDNDYVTPILVGDHEKIKSKMKQMNIQDISGIEITNAAISPHNEMYTKYAYNKLHRNGFLKRDCIRSVKNKRNFFSSCMLACGHGDALITGLTREYHRTIKEVFNILIDPEQLVFGMAISAFEDRTIFIADTSVIENPTAEELAQIAIFAAKQTEILGFTPRVAFIDSSNFGSDQSQNYQKIQKAMQIMAEKKVQFEYDGEMSVSLALDYSLIKNQYPFCRLTAAANILIMPNVTTANSTYLMIKKTSSAKVIGPLLIGTTMHAVQIIDPDSQTNDIINAAIWAATHYNTNNAL